MHCCKRNGPSLDCFSETVLFTRVAEDALTYALIKAICTPVNDLSLLSVNNTYIIGYHVKCAYIYTTMVL